MFAYKFVLGPAYAYNFDSHRPYQFHNSGPKRCVIISACTPPTFCRQRSLPQVKIGQFGDQLAMMRGKSR